MSTTQSDAFVFFGATGDLAYKKIFPALANATPAQEYERGSWGPAAAEEIVVSNEGWHDPKPEEMAPC